jgi:acylphosphatase
MSISDERVAVRVVIPGRVQGVWFRGWTVGEAVSRGLSGWVRNRRDGSVEALFAGPADAVEAMVAICREGPPAAAVASVERFEAAAADAGASFEQRPTI